MNKKTNKNAWSEIYNTCNHNKYSQLTNVKGKSEIKSNIKNLFKNYKVIIIISFAVLLAIFIYAFRNKPITILYCFGFIFLLFILMIYSSTYKLTLDENNLTLRINFQTTTIDTNNLATIYISRDKVRFLWIPIYTYLLNIIYIVNEKPELISLPVVMVNSKSVKKLFSNIETMDINIDENTKDKK